MIRCTKCDTVNPDNAVFCSNCASFLEWTGEKVDAATVAAASSAPDAKPADAESPIPPAAKAEAEPAPTAEAKPTPPPAAEPAPPLETRPEPKPQPKPVATPEPHAEAKPEPQAEAKREPEAEAQPEPEPAAARPARRRRRKPKKEETTAAPVTDINAVPEPSAKPEPAPPPPPAKPAPAPAVRPWVAPPPPPPPPPFRRPSEPVVHHLDETPPELRTEPEEQPAPATPPADKPKPTFRFRAAAAASTTSAAAAAGAPAGASAPAPTSGGPGASGQPAARPPSTQPPSGEPASGRPTSAAGAAAAGATTAAAAQPAGSQPAARRPTAEAEQPAARKPTAEVAPRPRPRPSQVQPLVADQPIKPGDLVCSNCGTGNDPARRFCRRCGTSLATAVVARKPPWYRRLFRRNQRAYAAGERPGAMGETGQPRRSVVKPVALVLVLVLVVGLIAGYLFDGGFKRTVDGLIGSVGSMLDTTTHQANLAFDGDIATYWLADPRGGTPTANVPLTDTVNLLKVLVHSGAGVGPEFERYGRPKTIEFEFPSLPPVRKVLADDPAAQEFDLKVPAVGTYVFRIIDFYPASDPNQKLVALREVELTASAQP